jgi:hypothetical protein
MFWKCETEYHALIHNLILAQLLIRVDCSDEEQVDLTISLASDPGIYRGRKRSLNLTRHAVVFTLDIKSVVGSMTDLSMLKQVSHYRASCQIHTPDPFL